MSFLFSSFAVNECKYHQLCYFFVQHFNIRMIFATERQPNSDSESNFALWGTDNATLSLSALYLRYLLIFFSRSYNQALVRAAINYMYVYVTVCCVERVGKKKILVIFVLSICYPRLFHYKCQARNNRNRVIATFIVRPRGGKKQKQINTHIYSKHY